RPPAGRGLPGSRHHRGARVHHGGRPRRDAPGGRPPHADHGAELMFEARAEIEFDPITLDICWNRLIGVVNEQAAALMRTSFTSSCPAADIGGHVRSAEAGAVYEEGLFIPIMKLYEGGRINASLEAMIRSNVRVPDLVMGDFHAQIAGGAVGGDRLLEFMEEFGLERLEPVSDEIVTRTERAMREAIGRLRPGTYEYAITSDGYGEPVTITCRCEVEGDRLWVDFTGSSAASRRGVNVVMNYTEAYTTYGVKVIVSPDVPNNEGAFRVLRITA